MTRVMGSKSSHQGMTLVELLMVIGIMTLLMAVSIPMIRPAFQDRYVREAARQVNALFSSAQSRAAELGRPVAVWIERVDASELGSRQATQLFLAEVPPSFIGVALNSRVTVSLSGEVTPNWIIGELNFANPVDRAVLMTVLAPGERFTIKFDHKGFTYGGQFRSPANTFIVELPKDLGVPPGTESSPGQSYEIDRGPTRSAAAALTMPGDSVLDLSVSGMGPNGWQFDSATAGNSPVIVSFAPSGRVEYVYVATTALRPFAPVQFLVGRRARVAIPPPVPGAYPITGNLTDPTCLWITISERTGTVITADNSDTSQLPPSATVPDRIVVARELARRSAQKGGR